MSTVGDDALRARFHPVEPLAQPTSKEKDRVMSFAAQLARLGDAPKSSEVSAIFDEVLKQGVDPFEVLKATPEISLPLLQKALAGVALRLKNPQELADFVQEALNAGSRVAIEIPSLMLHNLAHTATPKDVMDILQFVVDVGMDAEVIIEEASVGQNEAKLQLLDKGTCCFAISTGEKEALFQRISENEDPKKQLYDLLKLDALKPNTSVMKDTVRSVIFAIDLSRQEPRVFLQNREATARACRDALEFVGDDQFRAEVSQVLFDRAVSNKDMDEAVTALRLGANSGSPVSGFAYDAETYDALYSGVEDNRIVDISEFLENVHDPEAVVDTLIAIMDRDVASAETKASMHKTLLAGFAIHSLANETATEALCQKHDVDFISVMQQAYKKAKEVYPGQREGLIMDICVRHIHNAGSEPSKVQARFLLLLENHIDAQRVIDILVKGGSDRTFLQEQLHIAKLGYAIEKNSKGLLLAEIHRGTKEAIDSARILLADLGKAKESEIEIPVEEAILDQSSAMLATELSQAIFKNDTSKIEMLYQQAVNQGSNLEAFFDQVVKEIAVEKIASGPGLALFWKVAVQTASEQKNFPHLQQLFQDFPKLQACGLDRQPQALFQEAIKGSDENVSFMKLVLGNFEAISKVPYQHHRLHPLDIFRISVFVQKELKDGASREGSTYVSGKTTGLARGVLIDFENHSFAILSKKAGALQAAGKFKKVTDAVFVERKASDDIVPVARRLVRITTKPRDPNRENAPISEKELEYEKKYGGARMLTTFTSSKRPGEEKITYIQEAFEHPDLDSFVRKLEEHPATAHGHMLDAFLSIGEQIRKMHRAGDIHNDLKTANVLARADESGWVVRVADFGFTFNPDEGGFYPFYGTAENTSPEYLTEQSYAASIYELGKFSEQSKANDMFAVGCMLLETATRVETPWAEAMGRYVREEHAAIQEGRDPEGNDERRAEIQTKLASTITSLKNTEATDPRYGLNLVCAYLLEPDPQKRLTIKQYNKSMGFCQELARKQITPEELKQKLDTFVVQNTVSTLESSSESENE